MFWQLLKQKFEFSNSFVYAQVYSPFTSYEQIKCKHLSLYFIACIYASWTVSSARNSYIESAILNPAQVITNYLHVFVFMTST